MEAGQCLPEGELIKSFRATDIFKNCRIKEELMRHTATVESVNHAESDIQDQGFRNHFPTCLMPISRILGNGFYEQKSSNLGLADT